MLTTRGGFRYSTSTGGTPTGRGGAYLVIDDPVKARDAHSEAMRESAVSWFRSTVTSRAGLLTWFLPRIEDGGAACRKRA